MHRLLDDANALEENMISHRRFLHEHAETGFNLERTREYVFKQLQSLGLKPKLLGKAGIVALIQGRKSGRTILLRADMDALPIREDSGETFSCKSGNMHACGHDMHTAMLLGAAKLLSDRAQMLSGTVKLMFQPAEEILEGASDMINAGVLDDPAVDAAVMVHVIPALPMKPGTVIVPKPGVNAPAADFFTVTFQGKSSHGSMPQLGIDPIAAACQTVIALQEIAARELGIHEKAVLTIGKIEAGSAPNVIADKAIFQGSLRTFSEDTRTKIKTRFNQICCGIGKAFRCRVHIKFDSGCPTLLTDENLTKDILFSLKNNFDKSMVVDMSGDNSASDSAGGSEDFSYISHEVPTVMLALAAGEPQSGYDLPLHHQQLKFNESVLIYGAAAYAACAIGYLNDEE